MAAAEDPIRALVDRTLAAHQAQGPVTVPASAATVVSDSARENTKGIAGTAQRRCRPDTSTMI